MQKICAFLVWACLLGLSTSVWAVPELIHYQAQVLDASSVPVSGTFDIEFILYDGSGPTATMYWNETHAGMAVTDGFLNVMLGSVTSLTEVDFDLAEAWLEIVIDTDTLSPREQMVSVPYAYRIATVDDATGGTITSDVIIQGRLNVGSGNANTGTLASVIGQNCFTIGDLSSVCGGDSNYTVGSYSHVGGGQRNGAVGNWSVVSGGLENRAEGERSTVGGGYNNLAEGTRATVGGGGTNNTLSDYGTIGGGTLNTLSDSSDYAVIGGGISNIITSNGTATIAGGWQNSVSGLRGVVGGGYTNHVSALYGTIAGGFNNEIENEGGAISGGASNVLDSTAEYAAIGGGLDNSIQTSYSTIGGGNDNAITTSGYYATIGGGLRNDVSGLYSTVGGGKANTVSTSVTAGTISGGDSNFVFGDYATVAGGQTNTSSGDYSSVSGGSQNSATGNYSCASGGIDNVASGDYSFAAGRNSHATHDGSFVWNGNAPATFSSNGNGTFNVRATGGVYFYTNAAETNGAILATGGGAWSTFSDRRKKENFRQVNSCDVLQKVRDLDITEWNYKSQDKSIRHMGPMAQDFYTAFGLGESDTTITTIDPDGVALAAIQELAKQNESKDEQIANLEKRVQSLENIILQFGNINNSSKQ